MKSVLTASEMRGAEQSLFDRGVKSIALMERAAEKLSEEIIALMPPEGKTCVFACGGGGNGGDGCAAARMFAEKGGRAVILGVYPPKTQDAAAEYGRAKDKVFACVGIDALDTLPVPDVWADCVFGIGLNRAPDETAARVIERMNRDRARGSKVIACDIPSGLCADTGRIFGTCVQADETVTFHALKRGHITGEGKDVCGKLITADIGIEADCEPADTLKLVTYEDALTALPKRRLTAHKNDFGHLLVIAGSRGMAGAAVMCVKAALRSGCGLVSVACPESITDIMQISAPEAMCVPLPETEGAISDKALDTLRGALKGKTAAAIGPGLSRRASVACIKAVLESGVKTVIDADALNIIALNPELKALLSNSHALTPHPGEAARLTGKPNQYCLDAARELALPGCAALVKGASSVIAGEGEYINITGCPGMAKGGSGDALTGIAGGLLAQGLSPTVALWLGSFIHGTAGEIAAKRYGGFSMLPTDLISCIGSVFENENA